MIIGEDKTKYKFISTTSNPYRDKNHLNVEFIYHPATHLKQSKIKNPNNRSHMIKRIRDDDKNKMPVRKKNWSLHKEDYKTVQSIIKSKKNSP